MNSKENMQKTLFRSFAETSSPNNSQTMSPISFLVRNLCGASLTPRKRLSLSSCSFDEDVSMTSVDTDIFKEIGGCGKISPNKENISTPYNSSSKTKHRQKSILKDVQNTVDRYQGLSPLKKQISPSKREHLSPVKKPVSMEECDSTSRDSGYSASSSKDTFFSDLKSSDACSISYSSVPIRKLNLDLSPSPMPQKEQKIRRSFASLSKLCDEDHFLFDLISDDFGVDQIFSSLFSPLFSPITSKASPESPKEPQSDRLPIRRCLSMIDTTPLTSRVKPCESEIKEFDVFSTLTKPINTGTPVSCTSSKRPQHETDFTPCPVQTKRLRSEKLTPSCKKPILCRRHKSSPETRINCEEGRPVFHRTHSESHVSIMKTLNTATQNKDPVTGDYSRSLALPVIEGKNPDLPSINANILARLMKGEFKDISSFQILDCRYPYEFEGGHIIDAVNWHHPKMILNHLKSCIGTPKTPEDGKRDILIFHCEFSAERGPRAQRLIRETDRKDSMKKDYYPKLHFPEMYLLEGGYQSFFNKCPDLCFPQKYIKMVDDKHSEDLKLFRAKSKSWASENKLSRTRRTAPKRR